MKDYTTPLKIPHNLSILSVCIGSSNLSCYIRAYDFNSKCHKKSKSRTTKTVIPAGMLVFPRTHFQALL